METAEFEERKKVFLERYKIIIDELKVDIFSFPQYVPDGQGGFKTIVQTNIVDTSNQPVKSPFQTE